MKKYIITDQDTEKKVTVLAYSEAVAFMVGTVELKSTHLTVEKQPSL